MLGSVLASARHNKVSALQDAKETVSVLVTALPITANALLIVIKLNALVLMSAKMLAFIQKNWRLFLWLTRMHKFEITKNLQKNE